MAKAPQGGARRAGRTEADTLRVLVLIHEQPDGTWGAGWRIFSMPPS